MDTHSTNIGTDSHDPNATITLQSKQTNWIDGHINIHSSNTSNKLCDHYCCLWNSRSLCNKYLYQLTICAVYIFPSASTENQKNYNYLDTIPHNEHILLIGDFNALDIEWDTYSCTYFNSELLYDFVVEYNLTQFIDKPIHLHNNILDLIATDRDNLIHDISIHHVEDFIIQFNHFMITFSLITSHNYPRTKLHIKSEIWITLEQAGMAWTISSLTITLPCQRIRSSQM